MTVVNQSDFGHIVEIYNSEGKVAAYAYIREKYGLKNPYFVITRIRKDKRFSYDPATDKYKVREASSDEGLFMSIDDLCTKQNSHDNEPTDPLIVRSTTSMESLIHDLMSDRLLELNKYVKLELASRTILIDQTSMKADGYTVFTQ